MCLCLKKLNDIYKGKSMIPSYLKCLPNAAPMVKQTIICGNIRFTVITSRLFRIEEENFYDNASQSVLNRSFEETKFESYEQDGNLYIKTEHLLLCYKIGKPLAKENLYITLLTKPYTRWDYGDIAVHNLGGTVSTLDRVSGSCKLKDGMCSIEGYTTMDDSSTALFDDNGWFTTRKSNSVDLYFFGYGHDYISCVRDYCRLTGEVRMLPAFALGNWWSRFHRYTEQSYLELMDKFIEKDVPLSVAVIDMDWHIVDGITDEYWESISEEDRLSIGYCLGWTGYTWNKDFFPDYKRFLQELHKRGLKATLNLHPSGGVRFWEEQYEDMAKAMGVDPNSKKAIPFDCLNPKFVDEYFKVLHFPMEKDGVDFWWMDWQQGEDYNWTHQFGIEKSELEVISPLWMLNHIHYQASKRDDKRGLIFSRFAGYGSQRFPIGFSGDTYIAWESLDFQPYFTVTASNLGYGWWSHDIGGHCGGDRDDELSIRWVQFGVFSPIFRLHSSLNPFLGREPWNYNSRAEGIISDYMRLRHQLFPYLYSMNYRSYKEQMPLMMPMYYTHPENRDAYEVKNQYWFGSELIVCPITKKADSESGLGFSNVWLPEGKWIDWFNGYVYNGEISFECFRSLEQMPIFCKAGAIVPMQKHIEHNNELCPAKELEIVIAAGGTGEFTMFEDDGISNNYESGKGAFTTYKFNWAENNAEFIIEAVKGDLELIPQSRNYTLIFKGFKKGCKFYLGGNELEAVYDSETNSYKVGIGAVESIAGTSVTVECESGLLHDNSDYLHRCYKMLLYSQTTFNIRNDLYSMAEEFKKIIRWKPEPIGVNMMSKAFYELALHLGDNEIW